MRVATFNSASFLRAYPCPYLSLQRDACAVLGRRRTNGRLPQLQQQQQITRTPAERKIPNAPSTFLSLLRSGPPSRQCTSFFSLFFFFTAFFCVCAIQKRYVTFLSSTFQYQFFVLLSFSRFQFLIFFYNPLEADVFL